MLLLLCGCHTPRAGAPIELDGGARRENHPAFTPQERKVLAAARRCVEQARGRRIDAYYTLSHGAGSYDVHVLEVYSYHQGRPMFTLNRDWRVGVEEDGLVTFMAKTML